MKKTTKGAIAAGAAAVLLAGGAGTMAAWNSSANINGGTVKAGELKITAVEGEGGWELNETPIADNDLNSVKLVPGDVLAYVGDYKINAKGDNLNAKLSAGALTLSSDNGFGQTLTAGDVVVTHGGSAVTTVTPALDGQTVTAKTTVNFNASGEEAQNATADLSDVTILLEQTN